MSLKIEIQLRISIVVLFTIVSSSAAITSGTAVEAQIDPNETIVDPTLGNYSGKITMLDLCTEILQRFKTGGPDSFQADTVIDCLNMVENVERQKQEQQGNYTIMEKECELAKQGADLGGYKLSPERIAECERIGADMSYRTDTERSNALQ